MLVPKILVLSIVIFSCATGKRIPTFAGPYTVVVRTTNNETDEFKSTGKNWSHLYYSTAKPKQPQYVRGVYFSAIELTDRQKLYVRVSKRSNNMWKRNAFVINMDRACSSLLLHAQCIMKMFYMPEELKCPLPKVGLREIKNHSFVISFPQFPVIPYGRYRFTMAVIEDEEVVALNVSDAEVKPKL